MVAFAFLMHWRPVTPTGGLYASSSSSETDSASESDELFYEIDLSAPIDAANPNRPTVEQIPKPHPFAAALLRSAFKLRPFASRKPKSPPPPPAAALLSPSFRADDGAEESGRLSKELLLRYLGKMKANVMRPSRRHDPAGGGAASAAAEAGRKNVVCRHLRKSRSASASAAVRRRDTLLLVEDEDDGILSAIAHCKRSFHSSADEPEPPRLPRWRTDGCRERHSFDL